VHELDLSALKSKEGLPLLHARAYYTLNSIPKGSKLGLNEVSTKRTKRQSIPPQKRIANKTPRQKQPILNDAQIESLLVRNTCVACHQKEKRLVGPAYRDIAMRKYSDERIVQLIYNPQPKNWPEYTTPMAAMPQVPKDEALKIAAWINSLAK